jgi:hypothetical protein
LCRPQRSNENAAVKSQVCARFGRYGPGRIGARRAFRASAAQPVKGARYVDTDYAHWVDLRVSKSGRAFLTWVRDGVMRTAMLQ